MQAGGAVGLWARELSKHFDEVHSWEPNPLLRECFHENVGFTPNVTLHKAALGARPGQCAVAGDKPWNMGSWWMHEGTESDVSTVDGESFEYCDLLMLDIEGAELEALKGAELTIKKCKPVIVVETKDQCLRRFGADRNHLGAWLLQHDYIFAARFHGGRDELWVPR